MTPYWVCSSELIPFVLSGAKRSRDPVELACRIATGFLDFARNDSFSVLFPALLFPNQ
jgi:hypothetical protein